MIKVLAQGQNAWYYDLYGGDSGDGAPDEFDPLAHLDPRWLDLAVKLERPELVQALAVPGHSGANAMLSKLFQKTLATPREARELDRILGTMIRVGHPEATDSMIALLRSRAKSRGSYGIYWIGRLIPRLPPAEAVPKLEALLPTLPEKMIDDLLDYVTELKNTSAP